jgi:hypothetical protein
VILRAMLRLIGEVAVWTGLMLLIALGIAAILRLFLRRRDPIAMVPLGWLALGGALVVAGLSDRLGLPQPLVIDIGRREVPVVWAMVGAVIGSAWAWRLHRRRP